MAEIDFEAAWADLKAEILGKPSHGQRDLLASMARLEVEYRLPAGAASLPLRIQNGHSSGGLRRVGAHDV